MTFVAMATPDDLNANAEFIRLADSFVEVPGARLRYVTVTIRYVCWGNPVNGCWLLKSGCILITHHEHSSLNSLDIVKLSPSYNSLDISTICLDHTIMYYPSLSPSVEIFIGCH